MGDKSSDLRVIRTKEAIKNALVELIEEKGFEAITVKDITTRAKINRGTFYSHFQDKYDLVTKCEEEVMDEIANKIVKNVPSIFDDIRNDGAKNTPFTILVPFLEYINQNRRLMKALLDPASDLSIQTKLKEFMLKTLFESSKTPVLDEKNLLVPPEYLVAYIGSAHLGVIQQWLNSDQGESPEEIAEFISTMSMHGPFFAAGLWKT